MDIQKAGRSGSQTLEATAVVRKNSIDFIEQVFALNEARRPLVMVNDEAQSRSLSGISIDRCIVPADQTGWYVGHHPLIHDELPAQVSYTSGTEGRPKGILLTHANLADAAGRIIDVMRMTAEIREYVGVPATFSFGLGRYRAISAVGGQAYLPPRGFDPLELARMLAAGQVNALSAVPTLLRILLDAPGLIGAAGEKLRWMEIGSQHMTAAEKLQIREMFPNAMIVQHYGLTEASRSTFLQISEAPEALLHSVGRTVGHSEVALGDDGRIRIRGPHVAASRIDGDGLHDLRDAEGWLQTNDLGRIEDGHLFFDGRADDLINCGGVKVSPDLLEERIRAGLEPGAQIAVAKVPDAQRGDGILVAVEAGQPGMGRVKDLAIAALQGMGVVAGSALHVVTVDQIPVTGTGKVQRKQLAAHFIAHQAAEPVRQEVSKDEITDVLSLFRYEYPGRQVSAEDSFETLGGDSLHYIQFSLAYEQRFGQLPEGWEKMTVSELQERVGQTGKPGWRRLETVTLTRAFFMICIVALHTNAFVYSSNWGAAYFLILLAGYSVARFQLPEIIRTGSVRTLWGTVRSVAIPTLLMIIFLAFATQRFELPTLLMVSNYLDPSKLHGFHFYFAEFYLQLLVLAAILFSFQSVRQAFNARPMLSALLLLVVVTILGRTIDHIWDGDYNFHRTPWNYGWAFALGMVMATAKETRTKLGAMVAVIVLVLMNWGMTSASYYVAGGSVLILFVQSFSVPAPLKVLVAEIAGASLFMYLSHELLMSVVNKVFGGEQPWFTLISSIILGVILAHLYHWVSRQVILAVDRFRDGRDLAQVSAPRD